MRSLPVRRPAWAVIAVLVAVKVLIHAWSHPDYGYFRDEFYYFDCAAHLDWGYVDHPPLSMAFLALIKSVFGFSLDAIRALPCH